jgi:uncharacterized membrane protein
MFEKLAQAVFLPSYLVSYPIVKFASSSQYYVYPIMIFLPSYAIFKGFQIVKLCRQLWNMVPKYKLYII